jgi:DNA-binding response OmpR family regulator
MVASCRCGKKASMGKVILIVDDETDFSELLQFRLRDREYEVLSAATGAEALDQARRHLPDAILMDLLLPDLDGLTLCEILRRHHATRGTPIIMISAVANDVTRHSAQIAGAHAFFGKPLDFERLKAELQNVIIQREEFREAQTPEPSHNQNPTATKPLQTE